MSFPVFLYLLRSSSIKYPVCYILVSSFLDPRVQHRDRLPVAARIKFKALMLAYRTTTGSAPTYFHSLLRIYIPSRSLRSASERRLMVPSQRGSKSLSRTFSFTIPGWWNDLPTPIQTAGSLSIFKQQLKTHLFQHYLKKKFLPFFYIFIFLFLFLSFPC